MGHGDAKTRIESVSRMVEFDIPSIVALRKDYIDTMDFHQRRAARCKLG